MPALVDLLDMKRRNQPLPRACRPTRTGMTLVELLILVACMGIVMMLAMPMAAGSDDTKVRSAARLMMADLQLAQLQSMGNGSHPRVIVFNPALGRYHIAAADTPASPIHNPVGNEPYQTTFGQGRAAPLGHVRIASLHVGGDNQLGFTPLGALDQTTNASITLACGQSSMTITINAITGQPTIQ